MMLSPLSYIRKAAVACFSLLCLASSHAAPPFVSAAPVYPSVPSNISATGSKPMLMLAASKDHTLFSPLYSDFEDLDGDGTIEITFKPDFKYYGYFDATKCYTYETANNGRFIPAAMATVSGNPNPGRYVCGTNNHWSGNFLNWATMTRLDAMRKMLYGGQRSVDTDRDTTLQMARLSRDSHSFVKYYRGDDIKDYTPFTTTYLTKTTGSNQNVYAGLSICNQSDANDNGLTGTPQMRMVRGNYRLWATLEGGTVCNWDGTSFGSKSNRYYNGNLPYHGGAGIAHEVAAPNQATDGAVYNSIGPVLSARVQACDADFLGEERCQAYGTGRRVVNKPIGLLQEFGIALSGSATEAARTEFGLITGGYDTNLRGGVLRKNMSDLTDEINPATGRFCFSASDACPTGAIPEGDGRSYTSAGTIASLNRIVLYGKESGGYADSNVPLPSELLNGQLAAWGNPMGEMVIQAFNYYAGSTSKNPTTNTNDTSVGMPVAAWNDPMAATNTKRTELYGKPICRPLNVLAFSSSSSSFDDADADSATASWFTELPNRSRGTLTQFTDVVGATEGINNTRRSVGSEVGGFGESCAAKSLTGLSLVTGVCPEAPGVGGSYKIAGAALYANTNRLRTLTSPPPDLPAYALKVKTYAASLAGGAARIEVPIPNTSPQRFVYISPEGLWAASDGNKRMTAALLTFSAVSSSPTHGAFIVTWNDSLFGGDYDMDITGYLRYDILNPLVVGGSHRLRITTDILAEGAGWTGTHGFSIIGSKNNFDGRYLTHRHNTNDSRLDGTAGIRTPAPGHLCGIAAYRTNTDLSANTVTPALPPITGNGDLACRFRGPNEADAPIQITFEMDGAENVILREPLWYAAKYGSFNPALVNSTTELPDNPLKWDVRRNDGKVCGTGTGMLPCQDGEPDGYFLARRPELLEKQLRDALEQIISTTNAAPAVSAAQLSAGGFKYIASFEPSQNSGTILAYPLLANGDFSGASSWDTGQQMSTLLPNARRVITNDGVTGKAFTTTTTYSSDYSSALCSSTGAAACDSGGTALTTTQRNELIEYLRGNRSREKPTGIWRTRSVSNIMGTVVNSSPWLQARPGANWGNQGYPTGTPTYASFATTYANRERMLWTGANDGMLHGFYAQGTNGGLPVLSYVPSALVNQLKTLASPAQTVITAGMDGSPFAADVLVTNTSPAAWRTYLFSSLGRGGRAVFALDTTNPTDTDKPNVLSESNAGSIFKWMFSSADDSDLGFVLGDAKVHNISNQATPVVRMNNNKFAVLIPNGMGSGSGNAFMFVLFVDGPAANGTWTAGATGNYLKLPTSSTLTNNGMTGVNWVDLNNDGKADVIYGTDIRGRLWKFDVSNTDPAQWRSAFGTTAAPLPMFAASNGTIELPITTSPVVSYPSVGGVMVGFGTGLALTSTDFPLAVPKTQRFYSIYDRPSWTSPTVRALPVGSAVGTSASTLVERKYARIASGVNIGKLYATFGATAFDPLARTGFAGHDGWYFNFPATAAGSTANNEMVLSDPVIRQNTLIFNTVRPTSASADKCFAIPEGSLYAIDPEIGVPSAPNMGTVVVPATSSGATGSVTVLVAGQDSTQKTTTGTIRAETTNGGGGGGGGDTTQTFKFCSIGMSANSICWDLGDRTKRRQWREIPGMKTVN